MTSAPTVLFVCVHNAGRSQLAAGLAAQQGGTAVHVLSAGTDPDEQVDAVALASLAELGIDRSDQVPTRLTDDLLARADVVVTLKPGLNLPLRPGTRYENWPLPDPQGWDLDGIRPLRDHLRHRVAELLAELDGQQPRRPDRPPAPSAFDSRWRQPPGTRRQGDGMTGTIAALATAGAPSSALPKPLTDDVVQAADVVITMGCGDFCPLDAGKRYLDWSVTDPAGKSLEITESIAADIEARVDALLNELIGDQQ